MRPTALVINDAKVLVFKVRSRTVPAEFKKPSLFGRHWSRKSYRCFSTKAESEPAAAPEKKKIVFLGTPEVAAESLSALFDAAAADNANFQIAAVVSQPASKRGRGHKLLPTPVSQLAEKRGLSEDLILTPQSAREESFLAKLSEIDPEICVTAAYGNFLPSKFLQIPRKGTVNIHPSLLPKYRGASPVQRALQDGVEKTGVSVAFTVLKMDAGPIIASKELQVDQSIKAPELLSSLFQIGTDLLLESLPSILDGSAASRAIPQDESMASNAPKVSPEEAILSFTQPAKTLHNKVRAFSGWPGTKVVLLAEGEGDSWQEIVLKVIETRPPSILSESLNLGGVKEVILRDGALCFPCGDGLLLEVTSVQPPSKQAMAAKAFWNGLRGRKLKFP